MKNNAVKQSTVHFKKAVLSATPAVLPQWFVPYTQWRMLRARGIPVPTGMYRRPPFPKNITTKGQGWVLDEWDRYLLWEAWIDSGRKGPRPIGLWLNKNGNPVSPGWAGQTLKLVHKFRPVNPPPPPPPPPPVPPGIDLNQGRTIVYLAQNPEKILLYPSFYDPAWTADPAYPKPSASLIAECKKQGRRTMSWGDCHTTFPDDIKKMKSDLGLDTWSGEGESSGAFQVAVDAGAPIAVINISALNDVQKEKMRRLEIKTVCTNELYLNQDRSRADRETWQNIPTIVSRTIAVYDAKGEASTGGPFPFPQYAQIGKWSRGNDCIYDPGMTDEWRQAA